MMVQLLAIIVTLSTVVYSWPDGAPCKRAVVESMNPLQAEEHAGGLQLTDPPYRIDVDSKCYWRNQAVTLTLRGNTTKEHFKGFVIQPLIYKGFKQGKRSGKLVRLDDNGSWRQQCFRYQDSVTNAHDEDKNEVRLWWKNDKDDDYIVQFVATVVKSQYVFWVKSVLSPPLPPCRLQRKFEGYVPPPVTAPPQTIPFKLVN
ncbi:Defense protein l(2)34Fc [Toxocara canis]|uniref:Defense protein l(2)34Fc n=1 Tax=Toxocara canis TaxID=6265 RepID=A0A0B2VMH3_TOXCA|nr:Defense protein l(2)34Fc [Toxocara canis]